MLASTDLPRQTKRPVAAKLREIEGQASATSAFDNVSSTRPLSLRRIIVPSSMRISENEEWRSRGRKILRQRVNVTRPIGAALGVKCYPDDGTDQRYLGDFDATEEEREKPQPREHTLCGKCGCAGAIIAQAYVVEAYSSSREQRDGGVAAQFWSNSGDGADLSSHGFAHLLRRHNIGSNGESSDCGDG